MANRLVPMDVDRARAPTRGRTAQTATPRDPNFRCFQCGQKGHFAQQCPQRQGQNNTSCQQTNLIELWGPDDETLAPSASISQAPSPLPPEDRAAMAKSYFLSLTDQERLMVASELGEQDFRSA